MKMKHSITLLAVLSLVSAGWTEQEETEPVVRVCLDLVDSSRIIGVPGIKSVPVAVGLETEARKGEDFPEDFCGERRLYAKGAQGPVRSALSKLRNRTAEPRPLYRRFRSERRGQTFNERRMKE
jgi:hypothetical protein